MKQILIIKAGTTFPDILKELGSRKKKGKHPLLVGFAAESSDHLAEGERKLQQKNLDLIVINDITGSDTGFEADTNQITILDKEGGLEKLRLMSKDECGSRILDRVAALLQ